MEHEAPQVTEEEFQHKVETANAKFEQSGLLQNDEYDQTEINLCLLVPESSVAVMIGKGGVNVNTVKAVSGANVSFAKKENSGGGVRKCFISGILSGVIKAAYVNGHVVAESQLMSSQSISLGVLVNNNAAGSVIGKGGENLKNIREQTGCHINMEKQGMPQMGGRVMQLKHNENFNAVIQAIYMAMRLPGFASQTSKEDRQQGQMGGMGYDAGASYGYGPAAVSRGNSRYSPYGTADVCALHGKKRGKQNLQPSPTVPGQYVCFDHDQCKGNAMGMDMSAGLGGYGGMGAMGGLGALGQMGGYGAMGAMGGLGGGLGLGGGMMGGMYDMSSICAIHNKKRGPKNLQPHPTQPGLYTCMESDPCKGAGQAPSMAVDPSSICATHGKKRGPRNLQPHPTSPGLYVCMDNDMCK